MMVAKETAALKNQAAAKGYCHKHRQDSAAAGEMEAAPILTNALADLAERVKAASAAANEAELSSIVRSIEAGHLLLTAREQCAHGAWTPFLVRAGVHERQARRLMTLARSGLKPDIMSDLGGIAATLDFLAERKLPEPGAHLKILAAPEDKFSLEHGAMAVVWASAGHAGHFHFGIVDGRKVGRGAGGIVTTIKPLAGEPIKFREGFLHPVWAGLEIEIGSPADWRFYPSADPVPDSYVRLFNGTADALEVAS